ncbi:MAG: nucleotide modification associated domain-containing protein [Eubacteriales bacterium]|nr:nucleotide modification associated domain-containing protein [Eubacteriales bacterium]MDD4475532.1 nucleotide modification associated domain-containing protein [Eubacteriales bacterium]
MTKSKTEKHAEICKKLNEIYKTKNNDYGDSFGETFRKLGIISAVTRITDKVNRIQSLCVRKAMVSDESVTDTLLDLANYAIMSVIELEEEKKRNA